MASELRQIGQRLRAHRLGCGLTIEEVAAKLNLSRATAYRLERDGVNNIDTLERVGRVMGVSVATLLGVGVEYLGNPVTYFERLRQVETEADWSFVAFGPLSYLLTSDSYDAALEKAMLRQIALSRTDRRHTAQFVDEIMGILGKRKAQYRRRGMAITNVLSIADIERFVRRGFWGGEGPAEFDDAEYAASIGELTRLAKMLKHPPIGVQIGLFPDTLPSTGFNLIRQGDQQIVTVSPFRLGPHLNVRKGVAMVTSASEGLKLYTELANDIWSQSWSGERAAAVILDLVSATQKSARTSLTSQGKQSQ
jgi:transcriptional regulator with XRE-family HTH domain